MSMPFDVIKTRQQNQLSSGSGALALARELVRAEGVAGLYRGLLPALLRAAPANAAIFAGVEATRAGLRALAA
jgi:solute carrier family 25 carnitine/acylcarnitine transporter 20/29